MLLLPLAGIAAVRQYENELVRSTEAQLLAQGALVRELFGEASGKALESESEVLEPVLDVGRNGVLPRPPDAGVSSITPDLEVLTVARIVEPRLRSVTRQTLAGIRIVDRNGIVVATSGAEAGMSLADRDEVREALAGRTVSLLRERISDEPVPPLASLSRGQRYRVFVAMPLRSGERVIGAVVLSRTPLDIMKALWIRRRPLMFAGGATLLVALLVASTTALFVGRPVRLLIDQARRAAEGERGAVREIRGAGTREMRELSHALATMARTIEQREDYIRTFASHVSHEFKTPLTTIRGAVELLAENADAGERDALLRSALAATARLQRLVEGLLVLARAEAAAKTHATTDVVERAAAVAARFRDEGFSVETLVEERADMPAAISADALDAVLSQLIDNARIHGASRGRIAIRTEASATGAAVVLAVSDDGPGISDANAERIFAPFFTTARDRGGTGLGLSIARALVESQGGTLDLSRPRADTTFRICVPAA